MGGDYGPPVTIPAALSVLAAHPSLHLILVGDESVLRPALQAHQYDASRLRIHHASQCVGMDELPSVALRSKKDSSMRVAINLVKEGVADACVSAGNTGALMATARFVLKTLPGIDRPAILSTFPTLNPTRNMRMLDLGANVDSSPQHLLQFAVMGSVFASAIDNIDNPSVYLLNIGSEEMKGNEQVRQTAELLAHFKAIHYAGFIEGDTLYSGFADVVVCDGFVGNVALKTTEGVVHFMKDLAKTAFMRNFFTKLVGLMVKPVLSTAMARLNPSNYNGAVLIGLQGNVIKSHGGANIAAFKNAIEAAMRIAERKVPELIRHQIETLLK